MNLLFPIKDFTLGIHDNTFFQIDKLSEGNYDDDIDQLIHSYLLNKVRNTIDSFTIPISLTNNFMEFSGLIFAHHIRLSREFDFCDTPIVIYGSLKLEQLLRLTHLARILLTSNVFYVETSKYSFNDIRKSLEIHKNKVFNSNTFLEQIQINPPLNYDSHHSVDNEFALIQWSKSINCYEKLPNKFRKEYDSNLFFKFLKLKHKISNEKLNLYGSSIESNNIKVLLIDDEATKGWESFYSSLFGYSSRRITFEDSGIDFKNIQTKEDVIVKIESKISFFQPDVVLLDIRLIDSDFLKETLPTELTGLKILDKIKEINKGIQVIIITASNKAWNFNLAKQKGANDFIIKDGFEDPNIAIQKLISAFDVSAKRAEFLKSIYQKLSHIKALINSNTHITDKNDENKKFSETVEDRFRKRMISNLEIAYELLDLSYKIPKKDKYLSYTYLQLFLLIEDFANPDAPEKLAPILYNESDQVFINHSIKQICILQIKGKNKLTRLEFDKKYKISKQPINLLRKMDTNFYVSSILIYKYGNQNSSEKKWTDVYTTRNSIAHEGYIPDEIEINRLLDFIAYFIDESNESNINVEKGLIPVTYEEKIQALKDKFAKR